MSKDYRHAKSGGIKDTVADVVKAAKDVALALRRIQKRIGDNDRDNTRKTQKEDNEVAELLVMFSNSAKLVVETATKLAEERKAKTDEASAELSKAARSGDLQAVKKWLGRGADANRWKSQALGNACCFGHLAVVKELVLAGADIHFRGDYAMCEAAYHGNVELLEYLIKEGADLEQWGQEAIKGAAMFGKRETIEVLLRALENLRKAKP